MALARKLPSKIYEIQAHAQKVTCLDLGQTGRVLVTGGQDRNVNLWMFGNDKCFMSLASHNGQVECVKFAYNDDILYSADENGIIKRWDLNAQPDPLTFYGHMKSVRTIDFHPHGEYVVSGSNDTTVRLWDVRRNNCIDKYRGHIANVNSVKFSPDGWWIASAGTEGSVIIWDIRMRKKVIEFQEHASPVTCVQFHPSELLLAAGRNDGTVDLYDLEERKLISRTGPTSPFNGHTVKCITFSHNGECLFVGTVEGISVIGWEPDRQYDHIQSVWSILGDMKVVNQKLLCGSFEKQFVEIHAVNIDQIIPFYNPSNTPFNHSQSSRKSFTRGNAKLRLNIESSPKLQQDVNENSPISPSPSSLSFDLINEDNEETQLVGTMFDPFGKKRESYMFGSLPPDNYKHNNDFDNATSSLKVAAESDLFFDNYTSDLDYYPIRSTTGSSNVVEPEREDFPVNNAQQPDYAPKLDQLTSAKSIVKSKTNSNIHRRMSPPNHVRITQSRKLSAVSSVSSVDLHKMDDNLSIAKKQSIRSGSPVRNYPSTTKVKKNETLAHVSGKDRKSKNITVQIMLPPAKPPTRSKTSIDLRPPLNAGLSADRKSAIYPVHDDASLDTLLAQHDSFYQELCRRNTMLQLVRNAVKSSDVTGALKKIIQLNDRSVLVDFLGALLECKLSVWNLDICLLLLPENYELLQSQHKFHCTRACDALRLIISNFLPIIRDNVDMWGSSLGVDVTREERRNKCMECRHWLLRIKSLPSNQQVGSSLAQLQNLIDL